jgi:2-desacetyl-2-hydroxyethyl bacteriochlorophyllide A dehydrogenase
VVDGPEPTVQAGEILLETTVTGVCGSDTHAAAGEHPFVALPYHPGHEVVGVVRATASDVEGIDMGDRVIVEPTLPCWHCKMCLTGRSNICENLQFFGCGYTQGGMAERSTLPADRAHVLPHSLSDLQAVLIEPLSTPVHAVRLAGGVRDKAVVILGSGTIGLLTLKAARHDGARHIVMTDPLVDKRERAAMLGADATVDSTAADSTQQIRERLGESADVVFDCVAIQNTITQAISLASKGGIVMVVGVPVGPVTVALPELQDLQVRLQGSATYMPEDYATATQIIEAGLVTPEDFITARYPLERAADAFAAAASGREVKVIVTSGPGQ